MRLDGRGNVERGGLGGGSGGLDGLKAEHFLEGTESVEIPGQGGALHGSDFADAGYSEGIDQVWD